MQRRVRIVMLVLFIGPAVPSVFGQGGGPLGTVAVSSLNGEELYTAHCAYCHGLDGRSIFGAVLGQGHNRAKTIPELVAIVVRGIPGTEMPPSTLGPAQAFAVIQFLRATASVATVTAGSAAAGATVFIGKGNCANCHRVNGVGSRLAPDLTEIGRFQLPANLESAILDPDLVIAPRSRFIRLVTHDGTVTTGRLLNQDTYSVQLIDSKEQLRSIDRVNLREMTFIEKSAMPSYRDKLSTQEIADLVSYLVSLRGEAP